LASAVVVAGLTAGPVLGADVSSMPQEQSNGAVSYVTGGIGVDEADAFRRAAAAYPLELQFAQKAQPKDEFLSNVNVAIRDRSGNMLLEMATDGPFLLARLPAGKYTIEAEHYGVVKRQSVEIRAGKHQRNVFVWATQDYPREPSMAARTERGRSTPSN
jgi:hypothetical protein